MTENAEERIDTFIDQVFHRLDELEDWREMIEEHRGHTAELVAHLQQTVNECKAAVEMLGECHNDHDGVIQALDQRLDEVEEGLEEMQDLHYVVKARAQEKARAREQEDSSA